MAREFELSYLFPFSPIGMAEVEHDTNKMFKIMRLYYSTYSYEL